MWKRKILVLDDLTFLFESRKGNCFHTEKSGKTLYIYYGNLIGVNRVIEGLPKNGWHESQIYNSLSEVL